MQLALELIEMTGLAPGLGITYTRVFSRLVAFLSQLKMVTVQNELIVTAPYPKFISILLMKLYLA